MLGKMKKSNEHYDTSTIHALKAGTTNGTTAATPIAGPLPQRHKALLWSLLSASLTQRLDFGVCSMLPAPTRRFGSRKLRRCRTGP